MGYVFYTFAVPLERVTAAYGSKDRRLLAAVSKSQQSDIEDADADMEDGEPPIATALEDLIEGKVRHKKHAHRYAIAFRLLCAHLGKRVEKTDLSPMWVAENLDDLLGGDIMKILGFYAKRPIPLPKWDGMPELSALGPRQCKALGERFATARKKATGEHRDVLAELGSWLKAGSKAGLVIFIC